MSPFILLKHPDRYVACNWDLTQDHAGRAYWVDFFSAHIRTILNLGIERDPDVVDAEQRAEACEAALRAELAAFHASPGQFGRVTILTLDQWRDRHLRAHGFVDAFKALKDRENARMLPLLPSVCAELDALPERQQLQAAVEGVFAGNIFDMGAKATAAAFLGESVDFRAVRAGLTPRPWRIDDFDAFSAALHKGPRKCVYFIDNAGSDVLLGALPLMRWMALRGTRIVLAANERPTLNDMTVHDMHEWWPHIVETEPSFASLPIEIVSTGTGEPLIDLQAVSDELNAAAADADLVILEGMGRGVESNLDAEFTCDAANLAMIKDESIAARIGGKVFDIVCRFR